MFPKRNFLALIITALLTLNLSPAAAQSNPLPDWSRAGYRGTGILPTDSEITSDADCVITTDELAAYFDVTPDDNADDSAGLQAAIDIIRNSCTGSYESLSLIDMPSGTLNISTEIHIDASFLILRGQGSSGDSATRIVFEPDADTIYEGIPDFDLSALEGSGTSNGGWIYPGRGAFRIQTRAIDSDYQEDYEEADANRSDFFEGSVNFHWKNGIVVTEDSAMGDTAITLEDTDDLTVGDTIWLGVPNTERMYTEQGVDPGDWSWSEFMRQQMFTVTAIDGNTITLDQPLEFDLPHDSAADGSDPIDGEVRDAKVVPLTLVEGVGLENFYLTQILLGHTTDEATFNYNNLDPSRAIHGIVFKWAVNSYVRGVHTYMTGSHAIVTEMVRNLQIEDGIFEGSWNKGKGGNGYVRLSKSWDSLIRGNTLRGMRHLAIQWSSSHNIVQNNDLDADINLHGGWERYNLIENNTVRVPFEHRNTPNGSETWYPIWWGAGNHAGGWSGASGPQNVFYDNVMQKQLEPGGAYVDFVTYGTSPGVIFMFGWDRETATGSHWEHLALDGERINSWTGNETEPFYDAPNRGINANCTSDAPSLVNSAIVCNS